MARRRAPNGWTVKRWDARGAELRKLVTDFVTAHGGSVVEPERYNDILREVLGPVCELLTTLGPLRVSVGSYLCTRFGDVDRARAHFGMGYARLNPHSGKWNFPEGIGRDAATAFAPFAREVAPLLTVGPTAGGRLP